MPRKQAYGVDGKPLEWVIQDAILDYLGIVSRSGKAWFWRARPSQYIRKQGSNVGFALHPTEVGMPDIMGVGWGYSLAIEVKRPGETLSVKQKEWKARFLRAENTQYHMVTSIDQVIAIIGPFIDSQRREK